MRRQQKHIFYGGAIGFGVVALFDILKQWQEHIDKKIPFTWDSYNGLRTLKNGSIGAGVGASIGYLTYEYKIAEESKIPFNSDEYLRKILSTESLKSKPHVLQKVLDLRENVKQRLAVSFQDRLAVPPEDTGSFPNGTAIASNYDFDIILPFRRDSYATLEAMYYDVHDVVGNTFSDRAIITKHTKAIGVAFEEESEPVYFDIVPGREIANYRKDKKLNLYVRPDWIWQRGRSFKTNVNRQQRLLANKHELKDVIRLLKCYKDRNGFHLTGILVEQCVSEALSIRNYGKHPSITENLLNSMEYISKKISQNRVIDYSNTNNNLNDKVSSIERESLADQLLSDIEKIEDNPRYIMEIFEL
jgi:hypothetical protein